MNKEETSRLRKLKQLIDAQRPGSQGHERAVAEYNTQLELVMIGLQEPLDSELEIGDEIILPDYVQFRNSYRKHGPYTIRDLVRDRDVIALVKVSKVSWRGERVLLHPLEVYKGDTSSFQSYFTAPRSWMPDPWFTKGETVLVFAFFESGTAIASGELGRLTFRDVDDEKWVHAIGRNASFWSALPTKTIDAEVLAKWESVRGFLRETTSAA